MSEVCEICDNIPDHICDNLWKFKINNEEVVQVVCMFDKIKRNETIDKRLMMDLEILNDKLIDWLNDDTPLRKYQALKLENLLI